MRRAWCSIKRILRHTDPQGAQVMLAIWSVFWGAWLLMPWPTFARSIIYYTLADMADERIWGAVAVVLGLYQLRMALLGSNGQRRIASYISLSQWLLVGSDYIISGLNALATVTYAMLASIALWVFIRTGLDDNANER